LLSELPSNLATGFAGTFNSGTFTAGTFTSGFRAAGLFAAGFSSTEPASFCVTFPTLIVPLGSILGSRDGVRAETTLSDAAEDAFTPRPELA
jgi:hypothetical protein